MVESRKVLHAQASFLVGRYLKENGLSKTLKCFVAETPVSKIPKMNEETQSLLQVLRDYQLLLQERKYLKERRIRLQKWEDNINLLFYELRLFCKLHERGYFNLPEHTAMWPAATTRVANDDSTSLDSPSNPSLYPGEAIEPGAMQGRYPGVTRPDSPSFATRTPMTEKTDHELNPIGELKNTTSNVKLTPKKRKGNDDTSIRRNLKNAKSMESRTPQSRNNTKKSHQHCGEQSPHDSPRAPRVSSTPTLLKTYRYIRRKLQKNDQELKEPISPEVFLAYSSLPITSESPSGVDQSLLGKECSKCSRKIDACRQKGEETECCHGSFHAGPPDNVTKSTGQNASRKAAKSFADASKSRSRCKSGINLLAHPAQPKVDSSVSAATSSLAEVQGEEHDESSHKSCHAAVSMGSSQDEKKAPNSSRLREQVQIKPEAEKERAQPSERMVSLMAEEADKALLRLLPIFCDPSSIDKFLKSMQLLSREGLSDEDHEAIPDKLSSDECSSRESMDSSLLSEIEPIIGKTMEEILEGR